MRHRGLHLRLYHLLSDTSGSSDESDQNFSGDEKTHPLSTTVNQQQEITIVYNGRACSFDLTELQARAIILMASRRVRATSISDGARCFRAASAPLKEGNRLYIPRGLSIKRSLQSFLRDRERRAKAASPYGL
ncbi:hypothetical protein SAY87_009228 [Trapa incisa]|uniref:Protein TIFY n=1 Tax=Trapa incisa TaxID=236973 RepID=A0AAN7JXF6_9MYRT|nr:hypothetical protein SAY87_009228 [Trapa incisa]